MAYIQEKTTSNGISFLVRYKLQGKSKTKSFTSKNNSKTEIKNTKKQAEDFAKSIEAQKTLGLAIDESSLTFANYAEMFFIKHDKDAAHGTKQNHQMYLKQINEYLGKMQLKNITALTIENYYVQASKERSQQTLKRHKIILNLVLTSAFKKDLIKENPMLKVEYDIEYEPKEKEPVNVDDFKKYIEYSLYRPIYYYTLMMIFYTGMRIGEIRAMTWNDINYENGIFSINKARDSRLNQLGSTKTKASNRKGILHERLSELLYEIKYFQDKYKEKFGQAYQNNNLIICNEDGSPMTYNQIRMFLKRLDEKTGVKVRPHQLRHTFVTMLQGMKPKTIQQLAGHEDYKTTLKIYTHFQKFDDETIEHLDETFKGIL